MVFPSSLAAMPAFLFSVGNNDDIGLMSRATGWRPTGSAVFESIAPADSLLVRDFATTIGEEVPTPEWVTTMRPQPQRPIEK